MGDSQPTTIYLADYTVSDFLIDTCDLNFELYDTHALVHSKLAIKRNPLSQNPNAPLRLDGVELELMSADIDGERLDDSRLLIDDESLTIEDISDAFVFQTTCKIYPHKNTALEGLYKSRTMFCTQCEAEGFRKITYYLDRPDVLSVFTTTVSADVSAYPVLLSNGDKVDSVSLEGGRHQVTWIDPFKKPCYLFALVAGNLSVVRDSFVTQSGKNVALEIYVEEKDVSKCGHAMQSLKEAMIWDERVYGREYDLNVYMIVAVDDFNMGAMENKGLNIFNTSCVLASPETTTDSGFQRVEAVVAHEYFHNWSGNRVTCRDWFQLSLKEGFTVYRDAEFSADMNSRGVKRIEDVNVLRTHQFAEDAGPMAHPIRPASFMEISNFYTVTVYEKGAEVVRMLAQLLGPDLFRTATDLYFDRFDGQAVTCDDFVDVMQEVSGVDLTQFKRWYSQAGTPELHVTSEYDEVQQQLRLHVTQSRPNTPDMEEGDRKEPLFIPLDVGLVSDQGDMMFDVMGETATTHTLILDQAEQIFELDNVTHAVVPSLLRGFSAPVKLRYACNDEDLVHLIKYDSDAFVRWDASQQLALREIQSLVDNVQHARKLTADSVLLDGYRYLYKHPIADDALMAAMFRLPDERYIAEQYEVVDPHAIHTAREFLANAVASSLDWKQVYQQQQSRLSDLAYQANAEQIAARSLKNLALSYLMKSEQSDETLDVCQAQFEQSHNMTDQSSALSAMSHAESDQAQTRANDMLESFYQQFKGESLVVNIWLQIQALNPASGALDSIKALMNHDAFDASNPNKLRALIGAFSQANPVNFHALDGSGYRFLADQIIELDKSNPQVASRLLAPLSQWRRYVPRARDLMEAELQRVLMQTQSKDVQERVIKSLKEV
ncbi:MAG: aminopeptidase N [Pseudomonadota bacterium]